MLLATRPYFSISSSGVPDSAYVSYAHEFHRARMRLRHHLRHPHAQSRPPDALPPPRSPASLPAARAIASRSSGLMDMCRSLAPTMPSACRASCARMASATSNPCAMIVRSLPSVNWTDLPISNFWSGCVNDRRLGTAGPDEHRPTTSPPRRREPAPASRLRRPVKTP